MRNRSQISIIIIMAIVISLLVIATSCSNTEKSNESSKQNSINKSSISVSTTEQIKATSYLDKNIHSEENIPTVEQIITTLCSDEFEGRQTFSKGNEKAGKYIADIFDKIGLDPLSNGSYFLPYTKEDIINRIDYNTSETVHNIVGYIKGKDCKKQL